MTNVKRITLITVCLAAILPGNGFVGTTDGSYRNNANRRLGIHARAMGSAELH